MISDTTPHNWSTQNSLDPFFSPQLAEPLLVHLSRPPTTTPTTDVPHSLLCACCCCCYCCPFPPVPLFPPFSDPPGRQLAAGLHHGLPRPLPARLWCWWCAAAGGVLPSAVGGAGVSAAAAGCWVAAGGVCCQQPCAGGHECRCVGVPGVCVCGGGVCLCFLFAGGWERGGQPVWVDRPYAKTLPARPLPCSPVASHSVSQSLTHTHAFTPSLLPSLFPAAASHPHSPPTTTTSHNP